MSLKLRTKYSIYIVTLVICIVLVLTGVLLSLFSSSQKAIVAYSYDSIREDLFDQTKKRGEVITGLLAENLINPFYQYDMQTIYELLSVTAGLPDVLYIYLYNQQGKIVHAGNEKIPEFGNDLNDAESVQAIKTKGKYVVQASENILDVSVPIWIGETPLGGIKVGLSLDSISRHINVMSECFNNIRKKSSNRNLMIVALITVLFIVIGVVSSILLALKLTTPIRDLTFHADKIGSGDYDHEVSASYHGELGDLFHAFYRMREDLKNNEASLRDSKELFEKTFYSQRDAIFILNNDAPPLIMNCNPSTERIFGYTREEMLNCKTDFLHVDNASFEKFKAILYPAIQESGFAYIPEFKMKHKNGTVFISEHSVLPLEDEQQQRIGWVSVIRNIDKQKQAEQALKYREHQLKTIFNNVNASVYISDMESNRILFVNKHMKTLFGWDLTGKICWQTIQGNQSGPCEFCTNDRLIDAKGNATKLYIWENYNEKLERWHELHDQAIPWMDGRLVRMEIMIDITNRKKMEKALLKAHDELELRVEKRTLELSRTNKQLVDTTNTLNNILSSSTEHAIVAIDLHFRILLYNPAAERILKYPTKEVIGKTIQEIHTKEKVRPEHFKRAIRDVRQNGIYEYDVISKSLTGEKCFIHCIIMPMKNENNDITGYILFSQDVTKIKSLQDRLVRSERLAATGQLAATIAHEINSPLQGIVTLLSFLKEAYATEKKLYENLEIVKIGFDSIKNTINKLMNLTRPGKEEKQPTHINTVIHDTISLVQFHMDKLEIKVNVNLASEIPTINASPSQLGHVFLNLINNAIEAMTGQSSRKEITINSTIEENNIVITIHDTGPGVNKKDMDHVFDPFYSTKKIMGLGVGLSVCNSYVEDHNGSIIVENHPSGGAFFTILLPIGHKI